MMNKTKTISIRMNEKTYEMINEIRQELFETDMFDENLNDSFIIRLAIKSFLKSLKEGE